MIAEWIELLGLEGDDPPWEGEPREIRASIQSTEKVVRIRIINIGIEGNILSIIGEPIADPSEDIDIYSVDIDRLMEITIVY